MQDCRISWVLYPGSYQGEIKVLAVISFEGWGPLPSLLSVDSVQFFVIVGLRLFALRGHPATWPFSQHSFSLLQVSLRISHTFAIFPISDPFKSLHLIKLGPPWMISLLVGSKAMGLGP